MTTTAVSVKLSPKEKKRLAAVAKQTKRSSHYIMREALLSHLKEMEERLEFVREAEEAWSDYKETGLHYTMEDIEAWKDSGFKTWPKPRKHE